MTKKNNLISTRVLKTPIEKNNNNNKQTNKKTVTSYDATKCCPFCDQLLNNCFSLSYSGRSRGGDWGARPPLFLVKKKKKSQKESRQGKQSKTAPHPS